MVRELSVEEQAQKRESDRLAELAAQNEEVRRAEHPEEFTDAPPVNTVESDGR